MSSAKYGSLPFEEAIAYFRQKLNVPTERWADIWAAAHDKAFMVAGAMKNDLLNDFRSAVDEAIANGRSIGWFKREFNNIVARHGWEHTGTPGWRASTIYSTNVRQSYNAGRYEQLQRFPYWEYRHGDSRVPRVLHLSWDGLVLPKDDPWWQTHFPASGYGCSCKVFGRSENEMRRRGLTPGQAPNDGTYDWTDKVTGEVFTLPRGVDPGFEYAPGSSLERRAIQKMAARKAQDFAPPPRVVPDLFSTVSGVNNNAINSVWANAPQALGTSVEQLASFMAVHPTKTLFIKQAEIGTRNRASYAIQDDVAAYLGLNSRDRQWTYGRATRAAGYTALPWDFTVVKVKSTTRLSNVDLNRIRDEVKNLITERTIGTTEWSVSRRLRQKGYNDDGILITWLHELGHQVHFWGGQSSWPQSLSAASVTRYGATNAEEFFAEHFVLWFFARDELMIYNPQIARWIDEQMTSALSSTEKGKWKP
ncbi:MULTISPECIES: phage minor head protein [Idiomarina]|uniref:phage minor head protein n=1 Tax=Idiomarina TaxID=135575 RepID=UPI00129B91F6|nr:MULTISPECIES: phage minor head protein [Idiomarina]MRJ41185.1 F protein [Idiomarina sp. FeN1]NCU56350.1 F protein [Idiomarina sp. FenA--70]NCU59369.1 F protein [Idiomarina sp. FenBw--71]UUN12544.1 F protein [Idiomarina loihiensis]